MDNYGSIVESIEKRNKEACEKLYKECDELSVSFSEGQDDVIAKIDKDATRLINTINGACSEMTENVKSVVHKKIADKTSEYIDKMKEFRIF